MNERMQELITAYLHRGSTPEQEKELFEACKNDATTSEHLRQHLILSLKLRGLRDDIVVGDDLHRAVEARIKSIDAKEAPAEEPAAKVMPVRAGGFRLAHLFGTGFAAAAAAVVVMLLMTPDSAVHDRSDTAMVVNIADTVYVVERDTVQQVREVDRPVYIVKYKDQAPSENTPVISGTNEQLTENHAIPAGNPTVETADVAVKNTAPLLADVIPVETVTIEAKTKNYIEQYNAMLVSVASVQLSAKDRISF